MAERVLTTRTLNRALLARQLLLARSTQSLPEVLEQVGGLQTQYAPSGYIGLWSRVAGFRREALTDALENRRVVQATLMRSTIHLVSAADYPLLAAGTRRARQEWWLRVRPRELSTVDMDAAADLLRATLEAGPRRQAELLEVLRAAGYPRAVWNGLAQWVDLVRVPPSGTWERRRADLYGLADAWLGSPSPREDDGIEHLVRRYLGGFGPARIADVASWAGLPIGYLRPAIDRLGLSRYRDEAGRELLDLPGAVLPDEATPAPVRFLPTWDANLLVHARRTAILAERHRSIIFSTRTPHSFPTFLVDGTVAGTWQYEGGRVVLSALDPLPGSAIRELDAEADRLAAFHRSAAPSS